MTEVKVPPTAIGLPNPPKGNPTQHDMGAESSMKRGFLLKSSPAQRGGGAARSAAEGQVRGPIVTFKRARSLRAKMTLPEVLLWQALRRRRLAGLRFRRQHPIGPYILDFYCTSTRLAVEIDGSVHDSAEQIRHDERRSAWFASRNIKVVRIAAADILKRESLEFVASGRPLHRLRRSPSPATRGG